MKNAILFILSLVILSITVSFTVYLTMFAIEHGNNFIYELETMFPMFGTNLGFILGLGMVANTIGLGMGIYGIASSVLSGTKKISVT